MKANPTEAIKTYISVKSIENGAEVWVKKGRYDSNGNFLNYITHTFTPAGWSETKYMEEMRWAYNKDKTDLTNTIIYYRQMENGRLKAYTTKAKDGITNVRVVLNPDGKVKTFYIEK